MRYYVYILLDPRTEGNYDNEYVNVDLKPFYVGKGDSMAKNKQKRHEKHFSEVINNNQTAFKLNPLKFNTIRKIIDSGHKMEYIVVFKSDSENDCFNVEKSLISFYKKQKDGGILTNIADGGSGGNTIDCVDGLKDKICKLASDRWSKEKNPNFNKPKIETYSHISALSGRHWNKGRVMKEETKDKIRQARHEKVPLVDKLDPKTFEVLETRKTIEFVREYSLNSALFYRALKKCVLCKGFFWRYHNDERFIPNERSVKYFNRDGDRLNKIKAKFEKKILMEVKKEAYELKRQELILKKEKEKENEKIERSRIKKEKDLITKPSINKIRYLYKEFFDSTDELSFSSLNEIAISLGLEKNYVRRSFEYGSIDRDFIKKIDGEYKFKNGVKKRVKRIDKNGEEKIYESITAASNDVENGKLSSVFAVCKKRFKTYKGYKFEYI